MIEVLLLFLAVTKPSDTQKVQLRAAGDEESKIAGESESKIELTSDIFRR
jgi:hypothetical protein